MCKPKCSTGGRAATIWASALLGLSTFLLPFQAVRAQNCSVTIADGPGVPDERTVHVGDTIHFYIHLNADDTVCFLNGGTNWVIIPDGTVHQILGPYTKAACNTVGSAFTRDCPAGSTGNSGIGCGGDIPTENGPISGAPRFMYGPITQADVGRTLPQFATPRGSVFTAQLGLPLANQVWIGAITDAGTTDCNDPTIHDKASGQGIAHVTVVTPHITVAKFCVTNCPPNNSAVFGSPIQFGGQICNTGDISLTNVTVSDNIAGAVISYATTTALGNPFPATGGGRLATNDCVTYAGSFAASGNGCGPYPDTVIACGTDQSSIPKTVCATNSATCTVCTAPSISVTKLCPATNGLPGGVLGFSGTVCNNGNVPLKDVTIVDDHTLTTGGNVVASYPLLTNGECRNFSGTIAIPANACSISDTLTARGTNICNGAGVVATASTNCLVSCIPAIKVYKQVVCYSNACEPFSSNLDNQKSATGVRIDPANDADCPAFCYRIIVTNLGNVTLSNLVVFDSNNSDGKVLNLSGCGFPSTLAPAGQAGSSASCIVTTNHCFNATNIVTATALGQITGSGTMSVSATDTNRVTVNPISVACKLLVSIDNGVTFAEYHSPNCATQLISKPYIIRVVVTNTGQYALQNVIVTDTVGTLGVCLATPRTIASLDVGGSSSFDCAETCAVGGVVNYGVSVVAVASQALGHVCDFNIQGVEIKATSSCDTCVSCVGQPAIKVWKQVVCYSNICEPFSSNLDSQKSATGVRIDPANDADCPAFCYRIIVTNLGNVTLSNLVVVDANSSDGKVLNLSGCGFPSTLAPAGQAGSSASCIVTTNHCFNSTNVVTATALGLNSSGGTDTVSAKDTNRVSVVPISVACKLLVSIDNGVTFAEYHSPNCATQLISKPYIIRVVVTNTGQYALQNVIVTDTVGTLGVCLATPRTIASLDVGGSSSFDCAETCAVGGVVNYGVSVVAVASQALGHVCDFNIQGVEIKATSSCDTCVSCVGQPAIKVWKQVVCYSNICEPFSSNLDSQKSATGVRIDPANDADCPAFCYRIIVTNLGNVTLSNLVVVDANSSDGKVLNLSGCGFPSTLAPAGQAGSSASCIVTTNHCFNSTNVVTATALGLNSSGGTDTVSAKDTNRVSVVPISIACKLLVSTNGGTTFTDYGANCADQLVNNAYIVRIIVTNTGSYDLQNVTIGNISGFAACFGASTNVGLLAVGGSKAIDCSNTCGSGLSSNYFAVSVVAEVSQALGHVCDYNILGQHITTSSSCATCVRCFGCPQIGVTKGVACVVCTTNDGAGVVLACASATGQFEKDAFGVRSDTQEPAFCYEIVVTNSGPIPLVSLTVVDDHFGTLTNGAALPVGGSMAFRMTTNWNSVAAAHGLPYSVTNTVVASAQGSPGCPGTDTNGRISATDFARAHIRPASIACAKFVSVNGGPFQNTIELTNEVVTNIAWAVTITNTGQADLEHLHVTDLGANDALPCNIDIVIPGIFPVGGSVSLIVCTNLTSATNCSNLSIDNDIRVVANAAAEGTNCVWDINGSNIVAQTTCEAHLRVFCIIPNACRVTGGGRQDLNDDGEVCPPDARYVTHGGQVGAPVGNKVCVIDTSLTNYFLGNPCIHGRWTHVRHQQGGGEGNFHARFFDTLDCACLGTNLDANCHYNAGSVVNGVCNPGDRLSGPEPRRAPSNKIAFTGVGDWTCEKGGREPRSCLFRVDIEDRGEPGNDHVLDLGHKTGRTPDRYRIRIWVLTDSELNQLRSGSGADPYLIHFRDCISACNGIDYRDGVCGPTSCSGSTCDGSGTTGTITFPGGCPVRTPNIDDGGELLHGNHQIHPAILSCDPTDPVGPGLAKP